MKKTLLVIAVLFTMVSAFVFKVGEPSRDLAAEDGIIEWHSYKETLLL